MTRALSISLTAVLFFLLCGVTMPRLVWGAKNQVIAEVNGEPIYEKEVLSLLGRKEARNEEKKKAVLDQLILYKLAIEKAKKMGIEKQEEVKRELNRILYRSYLKEALKKSGTELDPTLEQVRQAYTKKPLLRLRHLVLMAGSKKEKEEAARFSAIIQRNLAKGIDLKALVLRYSQDESASQAGDIDFRGYNNLPAPLYTAALKLKKGEVAGPIAFAGAIHFIELLEVKPFQSAFAPYKSLLKAELRSQNEVTFLTSELKGLLQKASIKRHDVLKSVP